MPALSSRFTASANRFIHWVAIPAVFLAYAGYLMVDRDDVYNRNRQGIYAAKLENFAGEGGKVTGLILGGSNAYYSLSAAILSEADGETWYNFALPNEAYSEANYHKAIETAFGRDDDRLAIKRVVYSSLLPLRTSSIAEFVTGRNDLNLAGESLSIMQLKPELPLYAFAGLRLTGGANEAAVFEYMPDRSGDIDFSTAKCSTEVSRHVFRREPPAVALGFFEETSRYLRSMFPNAEIFLVVPSEYVSDTASYAAWSAALEALRVRRDGVPYRLIFQPPIPDSKDLCTLTHHTNAIGREWRTRDLIARMEG